MQARLKGQSPQEALGVPPGEALGAELRAQPTAGGKPTAHRKGHPPGARGTARPATMAGRSQGGGRTREGATG
ncbi:Exonuclease SbcC [Actinacidiphila bryophytorum]|uniref:Exonuclease SbcC n=1 Tax=Actinacidiphila bryophytorum TaxID=1436133 RepID=A0A9W4H162_9ACTN|nr:Exonuclease SbcC [Actinacidiphila bryophytorum]